MNKRITRSEAKAFKKLLQIVLDSYETRIAIQLIRERNKRNHA